MVVTTTFKRCFTICHLSVPSHTGLSDGPALGPSPCAASPTETDGLCLPQGLVHKEQVPCKSLLSWRVNEGGREGMNGQHVLACPPADCPGQGPSFRCPCAHGARPPHRLTKGPLPLLCPQAVNKQNRETIWKLERREESTAIPRLLTGSSGLRWDQGGCGSFEGK